MTRLILIHGVGNKLAKDLLTAHWLDALAQDHPNNPGLRLAPEDRAEMVYWADLTHAAPRPPSDRVLPAPDDDDVMEEVREEARPNALRRLHARLRPDHQEHERTEVGARDRLDRVISRIAPEKMKAKAMKWIARDTFRYLYGFPPLFTRADAPAPTASLRDYIRHRFLLAVDDQPCVIIAHSQGTVIAYDCLRHFGERLRVKGLITFGSPLGLTAVQDKLQELAGAPVCFPAPALGGPWFNISDDHDLVDGLDPNLSNDYLQDGRRAVIDLKAHNPGVWKHSSSKYLASHELRDCLLRLL